MSDQSFVYVTYIATSPEKLWEALTSAEFTQKYFFGTKVQSDWQEGSEVKYFRGNGELDVFGEVLKSKPHEILTFTWNHVDDLEREKPTVVTFELQQFNETVKLTLLHENLKEDDFFERDDTFMGLNNGWPAIMSNLKSFMETGETLSPMDI